MVGCRTCRHRTQGDACTAFPGGIPAPILSGEFAHFDPWPGDGGRQYEFDPTTLRFLFSEDIAERIVDETMTE